MKNNKNLLDIYMDETVQFMQVIIDKVKNAINLEDPLFTLETELIFSNMNEVVRRTSKLAAPENNLQDIWRAYSPREVFIRDSNFLKTLTTLYNELLKICQMNPEAINFINEQIGELHTLIETLQGRLATYQKQLDSSKSNFKQ